MQTSLTLRENVLNCREKVRDIYFLNVSKILICSRHFYQQNGENGKDLLLCILYRDLKVEKNRPVTRHNYAKLLSSLPLLLLLSDSEITTAFIISYFYSLLFLVYYKINPLHLKLSKSKSLC